jgi:hypothetical protein
MHPVSVRILILFVLFVVLPSGFAQQRSPVVAASSDLLRNLPSALHSHTAALGDRVLVAGKERTVLNGRIMDEKGKSSSVQLTLQLPGLVRLEGLTSDGPPLVFDGETRSHRNTRTEEALLETFTSDTAEGMLASIKEGAAVQLIARRVSGPSRRQPEASRLHDIFEVSGPVRSSATAIERLKRYFFDSETGLLASTQYLDETFSPPIVVETRFSDWRRVDDSAYPGHVERIENGHTFFSLAVTTIAATPRQNPASFR